MMDAWKIKKKKDRVTEGCLGRYYRSRYFQILFNYPTTPPFPPITPFYTTVSPVDDNVRITGCSAETTLLYKEDTPPFLVAIILSFLYIYIYIDPIVRSSLLFSLSWFGNWISKKHLLFGRECVGKNVGECWEYYVYCFQSRKNYFNCFVTTGDYSRFA